MASSGSDARRAEVWQPLRAEPRLWCARTTPPAGRLHLHGEWQFAVPDAASSLTLGAYRRLAVGPDHVVVLPPYRVHAEGHVSAVRPRWAALFVGAELLEGLCAPRGMRAGAWPHDVALVADAEAADALRALVDARHARTRGAAGYLDALRRWLAAIAAGRGTVRVAAVPPSVGAACGYLQRHPTRGVGLGDVARAAGVGPAYLRRAFARLVGLPPARYHGQVRLAHARHLLAAGASAASVAYACGFADQSHFSRAFKAHFDLSPGAFRPRAA